MNSRREVAKTLSDMAELVRKEHPDLSREQAVVKAMATEEGRRLYDHWRRAEPEVPVPPPEPARVEKGVPALTLDLVERMARAVMRKDRTLTREQAVDKILSENPEGPTIYELSRGAEPDLEAAKALVRVAKRYGVM
jgi:hypothetical protein